jgi:hypothetical protein
LYFFNTPGKILAHVSSSVTLKLLYASFSLFNCLSTNIRIAPTVSELSVLSNGELLGALPDLEFGTTLLLLLRLRLLRLEDAEEGPVPSGVEGEGIPDLGDLISGLFSVDAEVVADEGESFDAE